MRSPLHQAFVVALCLASLGTSLRAQQWDPLKRIREKAEQLRKKVECAVNDSACIDKAKKEGAEVKTVPAPPGAPPAANNQAAGLAQASASPLDAAFTATPLAPIPAIEGLNATVVSDDGARAAGLATRGSRAVVVVDGQDGPPFDQIRPSTVIGGPGGTATGIAAFGPGGKRVAYIGVREGSTIAVVDGKEGPPFTAIGMNYLTGGTRTQDVFLFSEDGSRVAYVGMVNAAGGFGRAFQVVVDGTPGPLYPGILEMIFAGPRHAYVAMRQDRKQVLVVDGKEQPYTFDGVSTLRGNREGHIAFLGSRSSAYSVVVDGVEGKAHQHPQENIDPTSLTLAPAGIRVAYVVQSNTGPGPSAHLYLDGKVARSAVGFDNLVFSPDGKRFAGSFMEPSRGPMRVKAFVDGWTSLEYASVETSPQATSRYRAIAFSPDSKRFACIVSNSQGSFVIVDGKESPAYGGIRSFQFSADSRHYAFETSVQNPGGGHGGWVIVVDGVEGPKLVEVKRGSFAFSPDGARFAYGGATSMTNSVAVIDGQEQKVAVGSFQPRLAKMIRAWGMPIERSFVFSRDGRSLAYVAASAPHGGPGYVVVDGKPQIPGHLFTLPVFSADGKRFAHFVWFNQKWFLSVDGKAAAIDGDLYEAPNSLAFHDDGSVRFLVVKNNMLHRVVASAKGATN
jgi:hypothetical protein